MIFLNVLKILVDLSLYCSFAGVICFWLGGGQLFFAMLIPALCFGLSYVVREKKWLRILSVLPCALCFLIPGLAIADRVASAPAVFYGVYMSVKDDYSLSCFRQRDIFSLYWKIYIVFGVIVTLVGFRSVLAANSMPAAVTMLSCSVYLMRVLRHDREIYLNKKYLITSAIPLAVVAVCAWVLTIPAVLAVLRSAAGALYGNVIQPILLGASYLLGQLADKGLLRFLNWLKSLKGDHHGFSLEMTVMDANDIFEGEVVEPTVTSQNVMLAIVISVLALFTIVVLFLLFKKLTEKWGDDDSISSSQRDSDSDMPLAAKKPSVLSRKPDDIIRRQYQNYLKLSAAAGYQRERYHTSREIGDYTVQYFPDEDAVRELRDIYVKARYHGSATSEDAKKARELVHKLRTNK